MTLQAILKAFVLQQSLPEAYIASALKWFAPVAQHIFEHHNSAQRTLIIGLNGCQGSGKSTLTALLCQLLNKHYQKMAIGMSIDDFYLTKSERAHLGKTVHPLLVTRGVPGTHHIDLLVNTLTKLKQNKKVLIPQFDKSIDDVYPRSKWMAIDDPADIIILEGWCVGVGEECDEMLTLPVNILESAHDPCGQWREFVNQQLKEKYHTAFDMLDMKIMLQCPSFETVYQWRCEQEHKLIAKLNKSTTSAKQSGRYSGIMSDTEIANFIQYYERLTRHALHTLPAQCDIVMSLDETREVTHCVWN